MTTSQVTTLLLDLALILGVANALGALAARLGQPAVIGEVLGGILLGPTLLGSHVTKVLFPTQVQPFLSSLADVGIIVFMFTVGLQLERPLLRGRGRLIGMVSGASMALPFALGISLAYFLLPRYHVADGQRLGFVLFLGAAMSVTAFPVLARILVNRGMDRTSVGSLAMASAAVDDVAAWFLLSLVVAVTGDKGSSPWLLLLVLPYLAVMLGVVRPALVRLLAVGQDSGRLAGWQLAAILIGLMASSGFTSMIGLNFFFGAFLFGVLVPREVSGRLRTEVSDGLGRYVGVLLMPVFFVIAGLKVDLSGIGASGLAVLGLILIVAVGGKSLGAYAAARAGGEPPRAAAVLATLMNTRGLTELVLLSVGLQDGVLSTELYSLMVVMALVTTAMAGPLLAVLYPTRLVRQDRDAADAVIERDLAAARD